jgi:pimeloyl-ACP methyl ester carboxylesterase
VTWTSLSISIRVLSEQPVKLHYATTGSGPITLLLTHGLALTGEVWKRQVAGLAANYRVVTWDLRGHGRSESPDGTCVLGDLAADLGAILDDAAIALAVVLGHSAGSVIALQFALDYPTRAAGLILVGAASECDTAAHRFYEEVAQLAENDGMEPVHQHLGLRRERDTGSEPNPITFAKIARCMGNLHLQPLTPRLHEIRCPTLVSVGEKDVFGVDPSVVLSRGIAGAHLEIVPGRGHGLFLEDPEGFNHIVDGFLRRLQSPSHVA